jgi:uncharacterized protein (DUF4415 family)
MSNISKRPVFRVPTLAEDREIRKAAKADPDAQLLTAKQFREMVPARILRGRPKLESPKQLVSVRYSAEVIDFFRSTGDGWQARMDGVLKAYVSRKANRTASKEK